MHELSFVRENLPLLEEKLRLRGMECNAPNAHAEAFYARKSVLEP